jgi:hypothetical protein
VTHTRSWYSPHMHSSILRVGLPLVLVACVAAIALAVPHEFVPRATLEAAQLNRNFADLEARLAKLEAVAKTYPVVRGLGRSSAGGEVFCAAGAPDALSTDARVPPYPGTAHSDAFGSILLTDAGAFSVGVGHSYQPACPATDPIICAAPATYFLIAAEDRAISLNGWMDDVGAAYLDGKRLGEPPTTVRGATSITFNVTKGQKFALSLLSCSNNGPSLAMAMYDRFLDPASGNGLSVDYERAFHLKAK